MCGHANWAGACSRDADTACIAAAAARCGIGVRISFVTTGQSCGTDDIPCRIASVGTDVVPSATDLMVGQAGCALVTDVRVDRRPVDGDSGRRDGLTRFALAGVLCNPGNNSVSVAVSCVTGITVVLCNASTCVPAIIANATALANHTA
ncbi:MAG: hypothetical protein M0R22_12300, partial [Dehalococcoidia bacterium]|nr:hypothetical protein [Dehalococcoidia bacterium]